MFDRCLTVVSLAGISRAAAKLPGRWYIAYNCSLTNIDVHSRSRNLIYTKALLGLLVKVSGCPRRTEEIFALLIKIFDFSIIMSINIWHAISQLNTNWCILLISNLKSTIPRLMQFFMITYLINYKCNDLHFIRFSFKRFYGCLHIWMKVKNNVKWVFIFKSNIGELAYMKKEFYHAKKKVLFF